nr:NADH-quinone oxidoreductase subunit G [Burkholderiales bacterium]
AIVRRAHSLQKTRDAAPPAASMNGALLQRLGIVASAEVRLSQNEGSAVLKTVQDDRLPDHCVRVAAGHPLTAALGPMFGEITVERIAAEQVA